MRSHREELRIKKEHILARFIGRLRVVEDIQALGVLESHMEALSRAAPIDPRKITMIFSTW